MTALPTSTPRSTRPYTTLAPVYDFMMQHVNYRKWARYLRRVLKRERCWPAESWLDIGCGTGRLLGILEKMGISGDGCDPSGDMLAVARQRLPEAAFHDAGLPELTGIDRNRYAVATCLYDTMNYLLTGDDIRRAMQRVFAVLRPGGIFIFDMVSDSHCRQYFQHYTEQEVVDADRAYHRESWFDAEEGLQINRIRIFTPDGISEEVHRQRIYPLADIHAMIREHTGFELRHCYDDFSMDPADADSGRVHFVLVKTAEDISPASRNGIATAP